MSVGFSVWLAEFAAWMAFLWLERELERRHPSRVDKGVVARWLHRTFSIYWAVVEAGIVGGSSLVALGAVMLSQWWTCNVFYGLAVAWLYAHLITDWFADDDGRWKRRRARARNRVKWRMRLPSPVRPEPA